LGGINASLLLISWKTLLILKFLPLDTRTSFEVALADAERYGFKDDLTAVPGVAGSSGAERGSSIPCRRPVPFSMSRWLIEAFGSNPLLLFDASELFSRACTSMIDSI